MREPTLIGCRVVAESCDTTEINLTNHVWLLTSRDASYSWEQAEIPCLGFVVVARRKKAFVFVVYFVKRHRLRLRDIFFLFIFPFRHWVRLE